MSDWKQPFRQLQRSVGNMLCRCVVSAVNSSSKMQGLQIRLMAGEGKDQVEHFEPYGCTARPKPGAEGLAMFFDGDRSHGVVICVADRRYRLKGLVDGEVALYDDLGQKVHLTREGIVIATTLKCRVDAEDIELHAGHSYSWDVHGYGERLTWLGGSAWERKTWQTGAEVTSVPLSINPPEGP